MAENRAPNRAPKSVSSANDMFYSATASSLNKRPMGQIAEEDQRKKGAKQNQMKPSTKKHFTNVVSKLDTGVKKRQVATNIRQSNDLTAKKKDELFGRVSTEMIAKFLTQKVSQYEFIKKMKNENAYRIDDRGGDFNYTDAGYVTSLPHQVRLNKRPLTAAP